MPEEKILYVSFAEGVGEEVGEPAHPLIHLFKDREGKLTALEAVALSCLRKLIE